jgi:hypothetical protein
MNKSKRKNKNEKAKKTKFEKVHLLNQKFKIQQKVKTNATIEEMIALLESISNNQT